MPGAIFTETISGASDNQIRIFSLDGIIGLPRFIEGRDMATPNFRFISQMENLTPSEREFRDQEQAFLDIPPLILAQYQGEFVVSQNGQIIDHDFDLPTLTYRFFTSHDDVPVYITKIGEDVEETIETPFID